ncbi:MAG: monovalent cation/H+ antiporter complex subunit F [Armatimonadota bacterium]|nr:monovalent cation/H+ antiporter complex subunit F [Armatimonadota bacterium]MDR7487952.1 monovalent cation/H+ antiporter complex subunit F [Armatimonadota bacterium]MDR7491877.1 monovalent cation/H+ antiporter complex subunit F [Armatimonadota bacterium]MDR7528384.1 monovalent cation/H+ antiporter complex subunit F [Armatimonadota bacterium]MDR7574126.1 monovalent cation/H+ antiporter complex subunit F [Armatimonadota bacterium]
MTLLAAEAALLLLATAIALCVVRLALGPSLADRVIAVDTLALVFVNLVVTLGMLLGTRAFLDVAVALAALGFVGTVAAAQFIRRGGPFA